MANIASQQVQLLRKILRALYNSLNGNIYLRYRSLRLRREHLESCSWNILALLGTFSSGLLI